ncbi:MULTISPECIES: type II toxin -antitoxin system TacA 1-like antitoxin [unclassified Microcoleus]|uniref:type II toxin -antitoxin system TacA 1-like antitoxin n=1 Tax=unclassified Microcoleus TaxID=2642155 RepID=UPI002FCF18F9
MTKTTKKFIEQHQRQKLNLEDSEAFVNALLNPTQPNQALKAAALRYKKVRVATH